MKKKSDFDVTKILYIDPKYPSSGSGCHKVCVLFVVPFFIDYIQLFNDIYITSQNEYIVDFNRLFQPTHSFT